MDPVAVQRIVTEPVEANCYVVSAPGGDAVVLDPGGEADVIAAHLDAHGLRPRAALATHGHYDHVGAAAALVERYRIPFAMHRADTGSLRRLNFCRVTFHGLAKVDIPEIDIDLSEADQLSLGDLRFAVLHTPGHSPGSVCFESAGVLFTGDTLMATHPGSTAMAGSDPAILSTSTALLARRYPPNTAIHPGHGEPGRIGDAVAGTPEEPGSGG